jgi:hypothetical protein
MLKYFLFVGSNYNSLLKYGFINFNTESRNPINDIRKELYDTNPTDDSVDAVSPKYVSYLKYSVSISV